MQHYPESLRLLILNLAKLPGIGEKTAERLAIHILRRPAAEAEQLAGSIVTVKQKVRLCSLCYALSDNERCHICQDASRDTSVLCVVEQPADMISIEKSGAFNGRYHILGGALSPMDGVGPDDLRMKELLTRVTETDSRIVEVILATGTNAEGESTAGYIRQLLSGRHVKVSRIATGIPIGGDLKYIDQMTLKCALNGRHDIR